MLCHVRYWCMGKHLNDSTTNINNSIVEIRRSIDGFIYRTEVSILVRRHLHFESVPDIVMKRLPTSLGWLCRKCEMMRRPTYSKIVWWVQIYLWNMNSNTRTSVLWPGNACFKIIFLEYESAPTHPPIHPQSPPTITTHRHTRARMLVIISSTLRLRIKHMGTHW